MDDDFHIPPNSKELDNAIQYINSNLIRPKKDEYRDNKKCLNELLEYLVSEMAKDEVFDALFGKWLHQGSTYEKLKVGHPDEFDIDLELCLPVDYAQVKIETPDNAPGFARLKLGAVTDEKGVLVQKTVQEWLDDDGYLLRHNILHWVKCLLQKVVKREIDFYDRKMDVEMTRKGEPALTIMVTVTPGNTFGFDLVPCLTFDRKNLPANVQTHLDGLPLESHRSLKWSVVPKGPHEIAGCKHFTTGENENNGREWRMSFYEYEKSLMNGLDGMKPTIKLLKLLRDKHTKQHTSSLASYYIKTMFLWEIDNKNTQIWHKKDRGYLFLYMLEIFENRLKYMSIPFFWDDRHNLIKHLCHSDMKRVSEYLQNRRIALVEALSTHEHDPVKVLYEMFDYEKPHSYIQVPEYDVHGLVADEEAAEKQPLLQKQKKRWCFNWKYLLLLGVVTVIVTGGIVLYETQGKTESH